MLSSLQPTNLEWVNEPFFALTIEPIHLLQVWISKKLKEYTVRCSSDLCKENILSMTNNRKICNAVERSCLKILSIFCQRRVRIRGLRESDSFFICAGKCLTERVTRLHRLEGNDGKSRIRHCWHCYSVHLCTPRPHKTRRQWSSRNARDFVFSCKYAVAT